MMKVPVKTTPVIRTGTREALFATSIYGGGTVVGLNRWDIAPDGRFLINTIQTETRSPISVVLNWQELLKKR